MQKIKLETILGASKFIKPTANGKLIITHMARDGADVYLCCGDKPFHVMCLADGYHRGLDWRGVFQTLHKVEPFDLNYTNPFSVSYQNGTFSIFRGAGDLGLCVQFDSEKYNKAWQAENFKLGYVPILKTWYTESKVALAANHGLDVAIRKIFNWLDILE